MSFQNQISLNTKGHGDMQDITEQVAAVVNYLRTHFGNNYLDKVTAEDIQTRP